MLKSECKKKKGYKLIQTYNNAFEKIITGILNKSMLSEQKSSRIFRFKNRNWSTSRPRNDKTDSNPFLKKTLKIWIKQTQKYKEFRPSFNTFQTAIQTSIINTSQKYQISINILFWILEPKPRGMSSENYKNWSTNDKTLTSIFNSIYRISHPRYIQSQSKHRIFLWSLYKITSSLHTNSYTIKYEYEYI